MFVVAAVAWGGALAYSALAARVLYGDGSFYVLAHLLKPHRFNDYDSQRSFASFITQAPMLLAQRFGVDMVAWYAIFYSVGVFVFPALAMLAALFFSRRQPVLFATNAAAIIVYGFGANFINTEANLLFGLVWLSATILALDRPAPILRGIVLPVIAFALLRTYEGMLLIGPVLALWSLYAASLAQTDRERLGLGICVLLFLLGAVIGMGGLLAPRDPSNASGFLASAFAFLKNPHALLMLAALLAFPAIWHPSRRLLIVCAALSAACGIAYVLAIARIEGFYSFSVYYYNRAFMVLSLPVFVAALFASSYFRPQWLQTRTAQEGYALMLVPLAFAVAGDMLGTYRWTQYTEAFCAILDKDVSPAERLNLLKQSGAKTAWAWTHPTMSLLLRDRGSKALVVNDPGQFEPFDAGKAVSIPYRGLCQAPILGEARPDSLDLPMSFTKGNYPSYVLGVRGLSNPEGWATWSEGSKVDIRFARPLPRSFDATLRVASAFGGNKRLPVTVRAGNSEQTFVVDREPYEVTLRFREVGSAAMLSFAIPQPQSPLELGTGNDPRKLGIAFVSLSIAPK